MKKFFLLILVFNFIPLNAQELSEHQLDSLYNIFLRMNEISSEIQPDLPGTEPEIIKCGLGIVHQIKSNIERYSSEKQMVLKTLLQRPVKQSSMVSPSGFFRIHYDTTGTTVPRYNLSLTLEENVMQVAAALDSSFRFEVNFLGYILPPSDNNAGGDDKYDVYINNLGSVYGYTETEAQLGNQKYTSFIVIDNDYSGFYSTGLEGMQVTVAHEFHHAIQVGSYTGDKLNFDLFFYELSATAMEEFVYDTVNDYYAYMPAYYNNTSVTLGNTDGYEIAVWNIFLRDKFGFDILKRQWELLPQARALNTISASLGEHNSSFKEAFHEFGIWNFFTRHRAKQGEYFEEAASYPLARSISSVFFQPPDEIITVNSKPVVNSYITFVNTEPNPDDSLIVLVSNADYLSGVSNPNANFPFEYTLFNHPAPGSIRLNENFDYYFVFEVDNPQSWSHSEFLGNELIGEHKLLAKYDFAFPSPFIYDRIGHTFIFIPVSNPESDDVNLNIYTSSMDLMYSINQILTVMDGQTGIRWNVLNNDNQRLASGVYIYAVRSGNETTLGKLVIFNE